MISSNSRVNEARRAIKAKGSERQLSVGFVSQKSVSIGRINRFGHALEAGFMIRSRARARAWAWAWQRAVMI